jgi:hypothetical protein
MNDRQLGESLDPRRERPYFCQAAADSTYSQDRRDRGGQTLRWFAIDIQMAI